MSNKEKDMLKQQPPLLEGGYDIYDEIKFEEIRTKKRKRMYLSSFLTLFTIAVLCIGLIFSLVFGVGVDDWQGIGNILFPWEEPDSIPSGLDTTDTADGTENSTETSDSESVGTESSTDTDKIDNDEKKDIYYYDTSAVPKGEIPIIPMDLSLSSYGLDYIQNSTGLTPDTKALLDVELGYSDLEYISSSKAPTVLIIHTHGTEAYSENGAISYKDDSSEIARSNDIEKNVVSVGKVLGEALRERGVYSIHCEIMHDANGYRDAYTRAEETIRSYLERYPTIKLVIDVHRDSVVKSSGELVRPVALVDGKAAAQIMCVVGSSYGGEENSRWEANLALALQFREYVNGEYGNLCRPVYLKSSTYNQEIAPYSMLLEFGAAGNSVEEAYAACDVAADAICTILFKN